MSGVPKVSLFLYNMILLALGCVFAAAAVGRPEPMGYIEMVLSTSQNRIILGIAGIILIVLALAVFIALFKRQPREDSIKIDCGLLGQISMTIPAAKVIVNKAVQKVEGVKETKTSIKNNTEGLIVYVHMMINPDLSIPELSKQIQDVVKEDMLNIGGLDVHEVRVLVDDFGTAGKPVVK